MGRLAVCVVTLGEGASAPILPYRGVEMNLAQELTEHVSKAAAILARLEEEVPRYEERILAIEPKLKELGSIEARISSGREELERVVRDLETAKKKYADFKSDLV